jgi:hypothetical protein
MVEECPAPEAIVAEIARRHDIHPNHFMHGAPSPPAPLDLWAPSGG